MATCANCSKDADYYYGAARVNYCAEHLPRFLRGPRTAVLLSTPTNSEK